MSSEKPALSLTLYERGRDTWDEEVKLPNGATQLVAHACSCAKVEEPHFHIDENTVITHQALSKALSKAPLRDPEYGSPLTDLVQAIEYNAHHSGSRILPHDRVVGWERMRARVMAWIKSELHAVSRVILDDPNETTAGMYGAIVALKHLVEEQDPLHIFEVDCRRGRMQWGEIACTRVQAWLDGEKLERCVAADSKEGLALVFELTKWSDTPKGGVDRKMVYKLLRGKVEIKRTVLPKQPELEAKLTAQNAPEPDPALTKQLEELAKDPKSWEAREVPASEIANWTEVPKPESHPGSEALQSFWSRSRMMAAFTAAAKAILADGGVVAGQGELPAVVMCAGILALSTSRLLAGSADLFLSRARWLVANEPELVEFGLEGRVREMRRNPDGTRTIEKMDVTGVVLNPISGSEGRLIPGSTWTTSDWIGVVKITSVESIDTASAYPPHGPQINYLSGKNGQSYSAPLKAFLQMFPRRVS